MASTLSRHGAAAGRGIILEEAHRLCLLTGTFRLNMGLSRIEQAPRVAAFILFSWRLLMAGPSLDFLSNSWVVISKSPSPGGG
jgi:hypothetical protein